MKKRLAATLALVLFLVLAGTGVSSAYWQYQASVSSTVKVAALADSCTNVTSVVNAGFEEPYIASAQAFRPQAQVPGWDTTDPTGMIEIWVDGHENIESGAERQFVELNAHNPSTLSQTIDTVSGQTVQWSLLHRGRQGVDSMAVLLGPENGAGTLQTTATDGMVWKRYTGVYVVPAGQTRTKLSFQAISSSNGVASVGNFLDDVSFGSGPCLLATSTVSNYTTPGAPYKVGDTVEYITTVSNNGSSPAIRSIFEHTLPPTLTLVDNSLRIGTATRTTAADADSGDYNASTRKLTMRLGADATSTAGGSIAQGTANTTVSFRAVITQSGSITDIDYAPSVSYVNELAPTWGRTTTAPNVPITFIYGSDLSVTGSVNPVITNISKTVASTVTWTFTVLNGGPVASTGTRVRIEIPAGLTVGTGQSAVPTGTGVTNCVALTSPLSGYECIVTSTGQTAASGIMGNGLNRVVTLARTIPASPSGAAASFPVKATVSSTSTDSNLTNNVASVTATTADTAAPTQIAAPTITTSGTTATVTWNDTTDNVAVTRWELWESASTAPVATVTYGNARTATFTGLVPWHTYSATVRAYDAAGNYSTSPARTVVVYPAGLNPTNDYSFYRVLGNTNWCLQTASTTNYTTVTSDDSCGDATRRNWYLASSTDGYIKINRSGTANVLSAAAASPYVVTLVAPSTSDTATASTRQQWLPIAVGTGWQLQNRAQPTLCLSDTANNSAPRLATCNNTLASQIFYFGQR